MMRVIFLGTNGWYDTKTGNTLSILIETENEYIILDAGSGLHKLDLYIQKEKPVFMFLSHFHLDHIIGLHALAKFNIQQGIKIYGQAGAKENLNKIVNVPFTIPLNELPYSLEVYELPQSQSTIPFKMIALPLIHSSPCLGFRFEFNRKVLTFCTDTGYCENAVKLARNADLLITECSFKQDRTEEGWPHLNPMTAAQIALNADAKKLGLTHFDASVYGDFKDRYEAEIEAKKIFADSFATYDLMELEV